MRNIYWNPWKSKKESVTDVVFLRSYKTLFLKVRRQSYTWRMVVMRITWFKVRTYIITIFLQIFFLIFFWFFIYIFVTARICDTFAWCGTECLDITVHGLGSFRPSCISVCLSFLMANVCFFPITNSLTIAWFLSWQTIHIFLLSSFYSHCHFCCVFCLCSQYFQVIIVLLH